MTLHNLLISMPTFSSGKAIFFQGMKTPLVRSSDPTIQFRSDLRYVPMLGTFLSYERSLLRGFGSLGLSGHLPIQKSIIFHGKRHKFSMEKRGMCLPFSCAGVENDVPVSYPRAPRGPDKVAARLERLDPCGIMG